MQRLSRRRTDPGPTFPWDLFLTTYAAEMGGTPTSTMPSREQGYGIAAGGVIIHELGCTRMGHDPATSVVNGMGQAHDCKNVFVADGGTFVSQCDKNPTWTILALAWRTADYIAEQRKAGML